MQGLFTNNPRGWGLDPKGRAYMHASDWIRKVKRRFPLSKLFLLYTFCGQMNWLINDGERRAECFFVLVVRLESAGFLVRRPLVLVGVGWVVVRLDQRLYITVRRIVNKSETAYQGSCVYWYISFRLNNRPVPGRGRPSFPRGTEKRHQYYFSFLWRWVKLGEEANFI